MTAPGSIDEDTAWNLVRAVRPEYIGERTSTRVHHGLEHDVWLQVDGSGAWKTSVAVTPEARDIFELFLPIRLRTDLAIAQSAQSVDGRIATESGKSQFITGPTDLRRLHRLRALVDVVIVGWRTVDLDNPLLTVRLVEGNNPVRVVLDPEARLDDRRRIFCDDTARTLVVRRARRADDPPAMGDRVLSMPFTAAGAFDPRLLLDVLREHGYRRVLVEGGGITVSRFLQSGVLDRLHVSVAPLILGSGRPGLTLEPIESLDLALRPSCRHFMLGDDRLFDFDLRRRQ